MNGRFLIIGASACMAAPQVYAYDLSVLEE